MPRIYENAKTNFTCFDHFKEIATKTLNEIFGRAKPLDIIDFSEQGTMYKAIGYYDDEMAPPEQAPGQLVGAEQYEAEMKARAEHEAHMEQARKELGKSPEEIVEEVKQGRMSFEAAAAFGVTHIEGVTIQDHVAVALQNVNDGDLQPDDVDAAAEAQTFTKEEVMNATDAAIELASANGIEIGDVKGTGKDGNVLKGDVEKHIESTKAPAQENANDPSNEQPDA